jgi:hypothetical protein
MIVAGLDIASWTGLAVLDGDKVKTCLWKAPKSGKILGEDERSTTVDPRHSGKVGREFEDFLRAWLLEHGVQHVAIEMPLRSNAQKTVTRVKDRGFAGQSVVKEQHSITSMATIYRLYGLNFMAATVCARLGIPCELVNQTEWRKAFLGSGSPKDAKDAAVEQCRRLRIPINSKDEAEAVGIAWWLRGHLNPRQFARANDLFALPPTTPQTIAEAT